MLCNACGTRYRRTNSLGPSTPAGNRPGVAAHAAHAASKKRTPGLARGEGFRRHRPRAAREEDQVRQRRRARGPRPRVRPKVRPERSGVTAREREKQEKEAARRRRAARSIRLGAAARFTQRGQQKTNGNENTFQFGEERGWRRAGRTVRVVGSNGKRGAKKSREGEKRSTHVDGGEVRRATDDEGESAGRLFAWERARSPGCRFRRGRRRRRHYLRRWGNARAMYHARARPWRVAQQKQLIHGNKR